MDCELILGYHAQPKCFQLHFYESYQPFLKPEKSLVTQVFRKILNHYELRKHCMCSHIYAIVHAIAKMKFKANESVTIKAGKF